MTPRFLRLYWVLVASAFFMTGIIFGRGLTTSVRARVVVASPTPTEEPTPNEWFAVSVPSECKGGVRSYFDSAGSNERESLVCGNGRAFYRGGFERNLYDHPTAEPR